MPCMILNRLLQSRISRDESGHDLRVRLSVCVCVKIEEFELTK